MRSPSEQASDFNCPCRVPQHVITSCQVALDNAVHCVSAHVFMQTQARIHILQLRASGHVPADSLQTTRLSCPHTQPVLLVCPHRSLPDTSEQWRLGCCLLTRHGAVVPLIPGSLSVLRRRRPLANRPPGSWSMESVCFPLLCAPFTKDEGIKSRSGLQVGLKNQQTMAVQVANQVTSMAGMNTACYLNLSPTDGRCLINMDRHYYCTSPT